MTITISDFNAVQARIARVMGVGDGDYGYGQQILSSAQDPQTGELVWATYDNLRTDILYARYHQIGNATLPIQPIESPAVPSAEVWASMKSVLTQVEGSRTVTPPSDQLYRNNLITGIITTEWNSSTVQTVSVIFNSADDMRNYFNTGSSIEFSATRTGGSNTGKNSSWTNLLSSMGVISLKQGSTRSSTSLSSGIGFSSLTTFDKVIFQKYALESAYVQNSYTILAKITQSGTAITFTITFADDATTAVENDPNISGTLTSIVNSYYAIGNYVTVMTPPNALGSITAGTANPTFIIDRDSATISEGLTGVTFNITSTNFNNTATPAPVYWRIVGNGISASDFEETKDSGTLNGQFDIISNSGSFSLNATADALTEGTERFNIELRTSPTGPVVASIANALQQILDLSKVPVNVVLPSTYTFLAVSKTVVPEGDLVSFTIVTTNVPDNAEVYWITRLLTAGMTADDFTDRKLDGIVNVSGNVCTIDRILVKNDMYDEGIESFQLQAYSITNGVKTLRAASSIIQVTDTIAALPDVPFTVVSNNFVTSIQEGSNLGVTFKISTPKLPANTPLYWLIVGELGKITSADFVGNTLTGTVLVNAQSSSLTLYATSNSYNGNDGGTEGLERFRVYFYRDTTRTDQVLESDAIDITENVPYTITRTVASMVEGETGVVFTVTTPYFSNDATELFWTTASATGTITAEDFEDGQLSGSVWITKTTGTITRRARKDLGTEGSEQFYLELRATPGTSGPLLATSISQLTTITENIQYTISPSSTTLSEGAVGVTFTINTPKLPSGTLVYWETLSTNGVVNAADFTDNKTAGTVSVVDNTATLVRTALTDNLTEGNESFTIRVRFPGNASGSIVASSEEITISELVPYKITPTTNLITEGSAAVQFNISTPKVPANTVLKWKLVALGSITDDDVIVSDNMDSPTTRRLTGTVNIGSNNKGAFTITARQDSLVEDREGFKIELLDQEDEILATSPIININDVSPFRMEFSTGTPTVTIWEGGLDSNNQVAEDAATINVFTPWLADGTELYWTTAAQMGTISSTDFVDNTLIGKVVIYNNRGQIIRKAAADKLTEGNDAFYIQLRETDYTSPVVASSGVILVTNTSNTPVVPEPVTTTYVVTVNDNVTAVTEGDSVTFHVTTNPRVATGTDLYWSLYKGANVTASDFQLGAGSPTTGLFQVNANGWADIVITPIADQLVEGSETFLFQVHEGDPQSTMPKAASPVVIINDAVQYSVSSSKSMAEGSSAVIFTVKTPRIAWGTTLVWNVVSGTGSITASDFVENTLSGTVEINMQGVGTFTLTAADDQTTEGNESFNVIIVRNSETVATGWSISLTEMAAYTLSANALIVDEGQPVTYTINTPKLSTDTQYTWTAVKDSGNTVGISPASGNFTVTASQTTAQFVVTSTANTITEGTRSYHLEIVKTSTGQPIVITGNNPIVTIKETVTTITYVQPPNPVNPTLPSTEPVQQVVTIVPSVPFRITLPVGSPTSVVGGDPAIVFLVTTPEMADGDLTWELVSTIAGKVTSADVDAITGLVSISANSGSFSILPLQNESSIDTSKTFTVRLRRANGQLITLGSSAPIITITKPVQYTYTVLPASIKEGGARMVVTVHTPAESASQTLNWTINTVDGTIEAADFTGNTLTGTVSINSSGTGTFYVTAATDAITETDSFNFSFTKASGDSITFSTAPTVTILDVQAAAANWTIDVIDEPRLTVREKGSKAFTVTAPVGFKANSVAWRLVGDNLTINSSVISATGVLNGVVVFTDPTADPKVGTAMVKLDDARSPLKVGSQFHIEVVPFLTSSETLSLATPAPVVTVVEAQPFTVAVSVRKPDAPNVEISKTSVAVGQDALFTLQQPQGESLTTAWWQIIGNVPSAKVNGTMMGTVEIDPLTYSGTVTISIAGGSIRPVQQSFMVKFYRSSSMQPKDEIVIKTGSPTLSLAFEETIILPDEPVTPVLPIDPDPIQPITPIDPVILDPIDPPQPITPVIPEVPAAPKPSVNLLTYPGTLKEGSSIEFKIIVQNVTGPVSLNWVVRAPANETLLGISSVSGSNITTGTLQTDSVSLSTRTKHGIQASDLTQYDETKCTITKLKLFTKKTAGVDICGPFNVEFTLPDGITVTTTDIVISDVAITQTYTTSGTWTIPKNCTQVALKAFGGGGGAGGYDNANLQYLGGIGGDSAQVVVTHRLPIGTKSLRVTVGRGGGGGSRHKAAGTGGTGYRAGGAGGQYRSIGSSGSGGGGGGGTAIEAVLTTGKTVLLLFVGGGGGGGGGSLNRKGEDGANALLTNADLSAVTVGQTALKQTQDGGTGGGGGAGSGTYGVNGKDKSTGGAGGSGGVVYSNPDTQAAAPVITRALGSGGTVKAKGITSPGQNGQAAISTIPGDCRAEVVKTIDLPAETTVIATPPQEASLDPNMFRKDGTWTTPAGVSKVRFTATAAGSSSIAQYSSKNNDNNPLVSRAGASGATIQWTEPTVEGDVFDIVVGKQSSLPVPKMNKGKVVGDGGAATILRKNGNVLFHLGAGTVSVSSTGVTTSIGGKVLVKPTGISSSSYANGFPMTAGKDSFTKMYATPDSTGAGLPRPDEASYWFHYDNAVSTKQPAIPTTGRSYIKFPNASQITALAGKIMPSRLGLWEYGGGLLVEPVQSVVASTSGGVTGGNTQAQTNVDLVTVTTTTGGIATVVAKVTGVTKDTPDVTAVKFTAAISAAATISAEQAIAKIQESAKTAKAAKTVYDKAVLSEKSTKTADTNASNAVKTASKAYDNAFTAVTTAQTKVTAAKTAAAKTAAQKALDTAQKNLTTAQSKYATAVDKANLAKEAGLNAIVNVTASKKVYDDLVAAEKAASTAASAKAAADAAAKAAALNAGLIDAASQALSATVVSSPTLTVEAATTKLKSTVKNSKAAKTAYDTAVKATKTASTTDSNSTKAYEAAKTKVSTTQKALTDAEAKLAAATTATEKAQANKVVTTAKANLKSATTVLSSSLATLNKNRLAYLNSTVNEEAAKALNESFASAAAATTVTANTGTVQVTTQSVPAILTNPIGTVTTTAKVVSGKTTTTTTTVVAKPLVVGKPLVSVTVGDASLVFSWGAVENASSYSVQVDITAVYPVNDVKTGLIKSWTKVSATDKIVNDGSTSFTPSNWVWSPSKSAATIVAAGWKLLTYKITFTANPDLVTNPKGKAVKVTKTYTTATVSGKILKPASNLKVTNILY